MRVAVLGTGAMGAGVAQSLLRDHHEVAVWNRTLERAQPLEQAGATVAATASDAVENAEVILMTLFDTDAVLDVIEAAAGDAPADALWVQCSTIGMTGTQTVVAVAQKFGITLIEAMMLGTKTPAEQGKLTMLAAGPEDQIDRARPVLDAMGIKTVVAGAVVGQASALKLAANAWVASITAATAQSLVITESLGLDPSLFLDAIDGTASDSPYAHVKGAAMIESRFDPQFALDGLRKDIHLMIEAAKPAGVSTTLLDTLSDVYGAASRDGHGGEDIAAVVTAFRSEGAS